MSYWEDRYIEYLGERDGQFGGDAWADQKTYNRLRSSELEILENSMPIEELKCPDCGGAMVSRKSQYGTFWGCKAFPKCKGTRDSEGRSKLEREIDKEDVDAGADNSRFKFQKMEENDKFRFRK